MQHPTLPPAFLARPIAHRALHDMAAGRPENSIAAIQAAIDGNYGIEIDLQLSSDDQAIVFHDDELDRLTAQTGPVRAYSAQQLGAIPLLGGHSGAPSLATVLDLVAGQVPLLIELKDQHGGMGNTDGLLETATANALRGYDGDVALMSFNPHSVAHLANLAPDRPRGLTTCAFQPEHWPNLSNDRRAQLRSIPDMARVGSCFISHDASDLDANVVTGLKARGLPILCWTIRSAQAEAKARKVADNVTFEGYLA